MPLVPPRHVPQAAAALVALAVLTLIWRQGYLDREVTNTAANANAMDRGFAELPARGLTAPLVSVVPPGAQADAISRNAADPFMAGLVSPATPFRISGSPQDLVRARECLALAAMAEAGASDSGQRAVMQVILNRVRHPAFAKTVCGVVFEGSQRATGCQFTFTCDGSLERRYQPHIWQEARDRAEAALHGKVFAAVGNATHYHTDWVYPSWSPQLVKLARVETHLFYRWPGYWGSAAAARAPYRGGEPDIAALNNEAPLVAAPATVLPPLPKDTPKVTGGAVAVRDPTGRANFVVLSAANAEIALTLARKLCTGQATCRVMGWSDRAAVPVSYPIPLAARATLQFSYSRDPAGTEFVLYNCATFKGQPRETCIPRPR